MGGRAAPAAPTRPALAVLAVSFGLFGIARTTGSGWLIVILAGVGGTMALAAVLPAVGLGRVTVTVEAPRDATVGRSVELTVDLGGRTRPLKLRPLGLDSPWTGVIIPCRGRLPVTPRRRGVVGEVRVELRSAAPLGLVWWRRKVTVPLARPMEVGPRPLDSTSAPAAGRSSDASTPAGASATTADAVRTIRDYVAGDPIKLVHWPATARAGELMVKDLESSEMPSLVVAVDLSVGGPDAVEEAAGRAAGLATAALRSGTAVTLLTSEATGPRSAVVTSPAEVGRRLARAVPGRLPAPPPGTEVVVVSAAGRPAGGGR
ncbi:MAG: DUF58 domain-containing protein [Actinobacteria bacterium]|nr:DUF58 domain-containing protein [Actinomycetota bacterium]MBW3651769.1 DUF58 domain-containing protein [Actinomycetota bacterium]